MVLSTVVVKSVYHGEKSPESWHFERLPFVRVREGSGEGYQKRKLRHPIFIPGGGEEGGVGLGGSLFFILAKIYVFRFGN